VFKVFFITVFFAVFSLQVSAEFDDELNETIIPSSTSSTCALFDSKDGKSVRSDAQVNCVMDNRLSGFSDAYQAHMKAYPSTQGVLSYQFDVSASGRVSNIKTIESSFKNTEQKTSGNIEDYLAYLLSIAVFPEYTGKVWQGVWRVAFNTK
jgi:hypothetical protein